MSKELEVFGFTLFEGWCGKAVGATAAESKREEEVLWYGGSRVMGVVSSAGDPLVELGGQWLGLGAYASRLEAHRGELASGSCSR